MTYSFHEQTDLAEARQRDRSADRMAAFVLVLMVVWLLGAAVMFTAAFKGSTMSSASATVPDAAGAAPADAATPAAP